MRPTVRTLPVTCMDLGHTPHSPVMVSLYKQLYIRMQMIAVLKLLMSDLIHCPYGTVICFPHMSDVL